LTIPELSNKLKIVTYKPVSEIDFEMGLDGKRKKYNDSGWSGKSGGF